MLSIASITQNKKDGKVISYKFKVCVCRDEFGKQIWKCITGKLMGLQWGDIDFDDHIISISRNVTYAPASGVVVSTPKTGIQVCAKFHRCPLLLHYCGNFRAVLNGTSRTIYSQKKIILRWHVTPILSLSESNGL